MKCKKIILSAIAIMCLSHSVLYAEEELPKDKPGTAVFVMLTKDNNRISVATNFIEETTNHLQINIKMPVMNNFKNKWFQKKLNKTIKKNQLFLKKTIGKDAIQNYQYATPKGYPVLPYELMTNYHVKSNNDIFSLEITIYDYRGGAHGMTTKTYYNIDTNTSKMICLKDIVSEEVLNQEIQRQINERYAKGEMFFDEALEFKGINKNQSFYMTEEGQLVIVFGLYEIAPYAAGILEFPIPKEIINSYD
ncbi:MAG TPA: DUF3298 and DUF4163 domain-containing protein [Epulopiscium sp.]|nr:DUF3298 and DUF4163 domain-containing protein [Candidatus Epulonipiscium sp.]